MTTSSRVGRPGLRDVAQLSGVSISVASRALNRDPALRARAATVQRIIDAAEEVGYRPNAAGRALRTQAVGVLGVILPDVNNPFFSELLTGIEQACDAAGVVPLIGRAERLASHPHLLRDLMNEGRVDGFLVQPTDTFTDEAFRELAADGVPHVFLVTHPAHAGVSAIVLDDERGIAVATEHLLELGHEHVGFVGGLPEHGTAPPRLRAFEAAMAARGLATRPEWHTSIGYTFENGRSAMRALAELPELPTAVVVGTHNAALGVLYEARAIGIPSPDDLSVVALHDSPSSERSWPSLTAVRMPLRELGERAVDLLLERIRTHLPRLDRLTEPQPELVIRNSTAPPAESAST